MFSVVNIFWHLTHKGKFVTTTTTATMVVATTLETTRQLQQQL
jgi:hypothetical protein